MKIKGFGCSFIFGTDLADDGRDLPRPTYSKNTYPAVLARQFDLEYSNYARPGFGNLAILERILSQAACNDSALYIINWTWMDRFDYCNQEGYWRCVLPLDTTECADYYYRNFQSTYKDKFTNLLYIKTAIDTLQQKKQPFFMTYMDEHLFDQQGTTPAVTDLQNHVRPYLHNFDGKNFLEWSYDHGYAISTTKHPLEQAHAAAADYWHATIDTILRKV
jgi:hypothetical protein